MLLFQIVLCSQAFYRVSAAVQHPRLRSVLWLARQCEKVEAVLAKNLPHRSRENEFTDGRVKRVLAIKDKMSFTSETTLTGYNDELKVEEHGSTNVARFRTRGPHR